MLLTDFRAKKRPCLLWKERERERQLGACKIWLEDKWRIRNSLEIVPEREKRALHFELAEGGAERERKT